MKKTIHNALTQETIEQDFTENDLEQAEQDALDNALLKADLEIQKAAKLAVLDKLGITADEAKLLLG